MAKELIHSQEVDLDRTDRLPVLDAALFDHPAEDEGTALDHTANMAGTAVLANQPPPLQTEFIRGGGGDLSSLAESVRSVEERIARQNAEYENLTRAFERSKDSEEAAAARAAALAAELAAMKTSLESEQSRMRELDRALVEKTSTVEATRTRVEEALRESNRYQTEARTLRDTLMGREAVVADALRSLGERDAQLAQLQSEHSKIMPELAATSKSSAQLSKELQESREQANSLATELDTAKNAVQLLSGQLKRDEASSKITRGELSTEKAKATSFLEMLRTRDWRRGFELNVFRDMDAKVSAAYAGQNVLEGDRNRLKAQVATLEIQLAEHQASAEGERTRFAAELAAQSQQLSESREHGKGEAARMAELLESSKRRHLEQTSQLTHAHDEEVARLTQAHGEKLAQITSAHADQVALLTSSHGDEFAKLSTSHAEQAAKIAQLQSDATTREQEMSALTTQLQIARRPIEVIEAEVKRLSDELAAKVAAVAHAEEENRKLTSTLERTRGALEEREFLIRRLERSESNNANVLGRIQTSIERLGSVPVGSSAVGLLPSASQPQSEWSAELIRIDGNDPVTHVLSRRTRIGRAAGCELQIDSSSVSRHHALVIVGPREAIIEDLNSTNGVLVNGRKISRQMLNDGDAVAIGEIQFRYFARQVPRGLSGKSAESNSQA